MTDHRRPADREIGPRDAADVIRERAFSEIEGFSYAGW